jgi:hypothetical protein
VLTVLIVVALALAVLLPGPIWSIRHDTNSGAWLEVFVIISVATMILLFAWFVSNVDIR